MSHAHDEKYDDDDDDDYSGEEQSSDEEQFVSREKYHCHAPEFGGAHERLECATKPKSKYVASDRNWETGDMKYVMTLHKYTRKILLLHKSLLVNMEGMFVSKYLSDYHDSFKAICNDFCHHFIPDFSDLVIGLKLPVTDRPANYKYFNQWVVRWSQPPCYGLSKGSTPIIEKSSRHNKTYPVTKDFLDYMKTIETCLSVVQELFKVVKDLIEGMISSLKGIENTVDDVDHFVHTLSELSTNLNPGVAFFSLYIFYPPATVPTDNDVKEIVEKVMKVADTYAIGNLNVELRSLTKTRERRGISHHQHHHHHQGEEDYPGEFSEDDE